MSGWWGWKLTIATDVVEHWTDLVTLMYDYLYGEAGNTTECFIAGQIAGENAAAEEAWNKFDLTLQSREFGAMRNP